MKKLAIDFYSEDGGLKGFGPLGLEGGEQAPVVFSDFISKAIGVISLIAIIWFVFTLFTGAIGFISSGGDKTALEAARKKIVNGLIGLVITIIGIFIIRLVGYLIGIPNILNFLDLFGIVGDLGVNF